MGGEGAVFGAHLCRREEDSLFVYLCRRGEIFYAHLWGGDRGPVFGVHICGGLGRFIMLPSARGQFLVLTSIEGGF